MSLITYDGHTARAEDWYKRADVYFGIGGQSPWTPDDLIPDPEKEDSVIEDIICLRKIWSRTFVVPDPAGDIVYHKETYKAIAPEEIWDYHCRWVLVDAYINYDEAPTEVSYRKIGLYSGVKPIAGKEDAGYLLPGDWDDMGHLEIISHDVATFRSASKRERLAILAEF